MKYAFFLAAVSFFSLLVQAKLQLHNCPSKYADGSIFTDGDNFKYPNGNLLKDGNVWRYPNENRLVDGDIIRYSDNSRIKDGKDLRYLDNSKFKDATVLRYKDGSYLRDSSGQLRSPKGNPIDADTLTTSEEDPKGHMIDFIGSKKEGGEIIKATIFFDDKHSYILTFLPNVNSQPVAVRCNVPMDEESSNKNFTLNTKSAIVDIKVKGNHSAIEVRKAVQKALDSLKK